jgi:hypothetical protein
MARLPSVTAAAPTHCRVSITLRPSTDSEITSEVWLMVVAGWNGKFRQPRSKKNVDKSDVRITNCRPPVEIPLSFVGFRRIVTFCGPVLELAI